MVNTVLNSNFSVDSNISDLEAKIVSIKNLEVDIKDIQEKIKYLQSSIKAKQSLIEGTEKEIVDFMHSTGQTDLNVSYFHLFFLESEAVEVKDPKSLPENFQRVKIEADKIALKKALQAGQVIEGVSIIKNTSLQIR